MHEGASHADRQPDSDRPLSPHQLWHAIYDSIRAQQGQGKLVCSGRCRIAAYNLAGLQAGGAVEER